MIGIISFFVFLFLLSFLVFIHELGHFWTAKKLGVKVDEFGMGIPPRAWGKKVGDTIYSINWLPLGGFVKIRGEDMDEYDPKDPSNFMNKKAWQRSAILLAGVFMNFVLAVFLFYLLLGLNGWKSAPLLALTDYNFPFGQKDEIPNVVTFIENDSPAQRAGIGPGEAIVGLEQGEQQVVPRTVQDLRDFLKGKENQEVNIRTVNLATNEVRTYTAVPEYFETTQQASLGVNLGEALVLNYSEGTGPVFAGFSHSVNVIGYSYQILKSLVGASVEQGSIQPVSQGVSGPVGIFGAVRAVLQEGGPRVLYTVLDLTALLSLSLAVMNLLPIPALDGGRLLFILIEVITRRKPSQRLENLAHQFGFILLIGLLILITFKDIMQFIL